MKCYEKRLTGFCVTYLHNPFECENCFNMMDSDDEDFEESFFKFYSEINKTPKPKSVKKSVPLMDLVPKTQAVSKDFLGPLLPHTPLTSKSSKKKKFTGIYSKSYGQSSTPLKKINKIKTSSKSSKKTSEKCEKINAVKKQNNKSVQKITGDKIPGKGTLKRKRWFIEQLQQRNDNYEDDLFEDKKFGHFHNLLEDESDCPENYTGLKTPVFPCSLSPRETTPSPEYIDCFSAEQLSLSRKRGEEYQYRLKKRRKLDLSKDKEEPETPRVVHQGQTQTILERLKKVEEILNSHIAQDEKSDTEDDQYFSDVLK